MSPNPAPARKQLTAYLPYLDSKIVIVPSPVLPARSHPPEFPQLKRPKISEPFSLPPRQGPIAARAQAVPEGLPGFSLPPRQGPIAAQSGAEPSWTGRILPASKAGPHCGTTDAVRRGSSRPGFSLPPRQGPIAATVCCGHCRRKIGAFSLPPRQGPIAARAFVRTCTGRPHAETPAGARILPASKAGPHCGSDQLGIADEKTPILPASKAGPHCGDLKKCETKTEAHSPCLQGRAPLRPSRTG